MDGVFIPVMILVFVGVIFISITLAFNDDPCSKERAIRRLQADISDLNNALVKERAARLALEDQVKALQATIQGHDPQRTAAP